MRVDKETDKEETEDVEEGDTPEDLLDGAGEGLDGVLGLSSSQTNQLSTGEGESGSDEHAAESLEAVVEGAGVVPVVGTNVVIVLAAAGTTAEHEDEGDDHEDDGGGKLERRGDEFFFGVTKSTKQVDNDDQNQEDGNPDGDTDIFVPVLDRNTADSQFKRQDSNPLEHVVPTHGETPRGIDETSGVGIERTRDRVHDSEFTKSVDYSFLVSASSRN